MPVISVGKLEPSDREVWEELFRGYITFYERDEPQEMYDRAWREFQADSKLHSLGARIDGRLVGITHFLFHLSTSGPDVCYLQDLFTASDVRGQGVGRALIAAVEEVARARGCARLYWMTHETNATARLLCNRVAQYSGFVRYHIPLDS